LGDPRHSASGLLQQQPLARSAGPDGGAPNTADSLWRIRCGVPVGRSWNKTDWLPGSWKLKTENPKLDSAPLSPVGADRANALSDLARQRLLSLKGDPFLCADWQRVLFLHYVIDREALRPHVPEPFELELHEGQACVSLVALTMRHFRPARTGALL